MALKKVVCFISVAMGRLWRVLLEEGYPRLLASGILLWLLSAGTGSREGRESHTGLGRG